MSGNDPDRERLTQTMMALDDGLNRMARKYEGTVEFRYEDPETFGAGHFVFYPHDDARSRFAIEEQYTDTDWSDDDRVPTSWTWTAERRVRRPDGTTGEWGVERYGEARAEDFGQILTETESWVRRVQNRATHTTQFGLSRGPHLEPPRTTALAPAVGGRRT